MADDDRNDPRTAGLRRVSAVIGAGKAKAEAKLKSAEPKWPKPGMPLDGIGPGEWIEKGALDETLCLPDSCPIMPLGLEGEDYHFLDTMGQVFSTGDKVLGIERIQKLFAGCEDFLYWGWPGRPLKLMKIKPSFDANAVRRDLFAACRKRGQWRASDRVRGRGAWKDAQGQLIIHTGEYLFTRGELRETGEIDDHLYVRRPAAIVPSMAPVMAADNPAPDIYGMLETWNFSRGKIDRMFLLGSIGVSLLAGALGWRPSVFIAGDTGGGKSELTGPDGLLRGILGRSMISTTNATEAGLYQIVGHDSLPIAIDELEGDEAPEQTQKIMKMARDAASGSIRIRGGQNHTSVDFQAQSAFYFSSINPPPLPPASLTRLAILQLLPLKAEAGATPPVLKDAEMVGPRMLRWLCDRWDQVNWRLNDFYNVLREAGHDARGQKTFGTFLALATEMLGKEGCERFGLPWDQVADWGAIVPPEDMIEIGDKKAEWLKCFDMIQSLVIDQHIGGRKYTVAQVLTQFGDNDINLKEANDRLSGADLALRGTKGSMEDPLLLAVPNSSRTLGRLLMNTPYGHMGGNGSWRFALDRGPPEIIIRKIQGARGTKPSNKATVAGRQERCTFINLKQFRLWLSQQA